MPSTYSGLKLELIATGEQSGTWGTTTNGNLGTAIEQAIAGYGTANFTSDADLTLGYLNSNASQTFRNMVLNVTSSVSLTATRNLIVPTTPKLYYVFNNTTGGQGVLVKTSAGSGITILNGSKAVVYCDGTNVVETVNALGSLSLSSPLSVASGGTGVASITGLIKGSGTSSFSAAVADTDYATPGGVLRQSANSGTTSGSGTAYTLSPASAITGYIAGMTFWVTFHAAAGAAPTLQISGLASPPNLVKQDSTGAYVNIAAGDFPANHRSRVTLLSATQALVEELPPVVAPSVGLKNRIINGKMDISQRGTSFVSPATGAYTLDRWVPSYSTTGVVTISQQSDVPSSNEFQNSLRVAVTTADTSIAAAEYFGIFQNIEGFNVRDLIGRPVTLSFWVRSSKTGTHCVSMRNTSADRSYVAEYTINAANTWEQKSITVSGGLITAGTWNWTNSLGLSLGFSMACGSTFQTTAGAWQTGNFFATANQVNCLDTIGNIFAITGVQLEQSSTATPFDHRPYGAELALCQRYYYRLTPSGVAEQFGPALVLSATSANGHVQFPVTMRADPSALEQSGTATDYRVNTSAGNTACSAVPTFDASTTPAGAAVTFTVASGLTAGQAAFLRSATANGFLGWSAEL